MEKWIELRVVVPEDAVDAVGNRLVEEGAPGIVEEACEGGALLRAHFPANGGVSGRVASLEAHLRAIDAFFPGTAGAPIEVVALEAEDWAEGWKRGFTPIRIGERLLVHVPWEAPEAGERLAIAIEPAMAFGTGHHASTRGCLLALEEIVNREGAPARVLDVGTGSGILAIAAARLGAREVVAVDDDPIAIEAAAGNVERNGVASSVRLITGSVDDVGSGFSLVLANLYANLLRDLAATLAARTVPGGWLVAAGFLDEDAPVLAATICGAGWASHEEHRLEGWTTLVFRRES